VAPGVSGQGMSSPEVVRAILSGISRPPTPAVVADDGAVHRASLEEALPELVARAQEVRVPFTIVLARPGPAATGEAPPTASPSEVEDLAAALSVSVTSDQELMQAGPQHLAVVIAGRSGRVQREALQLMRRAAGEGAPLFTWAAARYPKDATTWRGILQVGSQRLDGTVGPVADAVGALPRLGGRRAGLAVWGAVAASVLFAAAAFAFHGSRTPGPTSALGTGPGNQSGNGSVVPAGAAGDLSPSGGSSGSLPAPDGAAVTSGQAATGSASGQAGTTTGNGDGNGAVTGGAAGGTGGVLGAGGNQTGTIGSTQATTEQAGGGTTLPTLPPISTTTTTIPVVGGLLGGAGTVGIPVVTIPGSSLGAPSTTTTVPALTQCTGLVQTATCTVNTLLGGGL